MKNLRTLCLGLFATLILACTSEKPMPQESNNELIKTENLRLLAKETKQDLESLLKKEGFNGVSDKNLSIGKLENNQFEMKSGNTEEILKLHFKLSTQEIGYDVNFKSFEYLSAKENNGFPMIISKGQCKISGENVSLGINVIHDKNGSTQMSRGGTTVTCTGCSAGCNPRRDGNGDGYCTACAPTTGHTCKKTETLPEIDP